MWFRMISNGSMSKGLATLGMPAWEAQLVTSLFALAVVAVAVRYRRERLYTDPTLWLTLGLVVLPISWISYDVVLLPALILGLSSLRSPQRSISWAVWLYGSASVPLLLSSCGMVGWWPPEN